MRLSIVFAAVVLAACAAADGSGPSLSAVRSDVNAGRWEGRTLIAAPGAASAPAATTSASAPARGGFELPPPSGVPKSSATRLTDPSLGIPLPGAASSPRP
jgi:hypothetical protein